MSENCSTRRGDSPHRAACQGTSSPLRARKVSAVDRQGFEDSLQCGLLEHGFLRVKCDGCRHEHLVAFSCKRPGFCPSCGARRMVESAAHLVDHVFPEAPVRQWVLTFPFPLRFLLAAHPEALSQVLAVVQRGISTFVIQRSGLAVASGAKTGAVTLIQRFGSALNLNIHLHMLFLDGAYTFGGQRVSFHRARRPSNAELVHLLGTLSRRIVRVLVRRGLLIADPVHPYLDLGSGSSLSTGTQSHLLNSPCRHRDLSPLRGHAAGDCLYAPRLHSGTRDGAPQVLFPAKLKVAPASLPALLGPRPNRTLILACAEEPALIARILGHVQQREELNGPLTRAPPGQQEVTFNLN